VLDPDAYVRSFRVLWKLFNKLTCSPSFAIEIYIDEFLYFFFDPLQDKVD
jgi:hypothetical protein